MARERSRNDFNFSAAGHGPDAQAEHSVGVAVAIVDHEFAPGQVAQIVREPGSDDRGTVVLSSRALDDHALFLGTAALDMDERVAAPLPDRRVLYVWKDGRVTDAAGGYVGSIDLNLLPEGRTADVIQFLRERAPEESNVEIPRLGRARLLKF